MWKHAVAENEDGNRIIENFFYPISLLNLRMWSQ